MFSWASVRIHISETAHWNFLKFCTLLLHYKGKNVTFSDFWEKIFFCPFWAKNRVKKAKIDQNRGFSGIIQNLSIIFYETFQKVASYQYLIEISSFSSITQNLTVFFFCETFQKVASYQYLIGNNSLYSSKNLILPFLDQKRGQNGQNWPKYEFFRHNSKFLHYFFAKLSKMLNLINI